MPDAYDELLDSVLPKPAKQRGNYRSLYQEAGTRHGVDPDLLYNQARQESSFNPRARSPKGALGIAQFMPDTARQYGLRVGDGIDERLIPEKAVDAQARLMKDLITRYGGDERLALAAYNSGTNRSAASARRAMERIPETRNYVQQITGQRTQPKDDYDSLLDEVLDGKTPSAPTPESSKTLSVLTTRRRASTSPFAGVQSGVGSDVGASARGTRTPSGVGEMRRIQDHLDRRTADTGVGRLRELDDPEVARLQRVERDVANQRFREAPRLLDPKPSAQEEILSRVREETGAPTTPGLAPEVYGPRSMQARQPGIVERAREAIGPYVPGITSIDTPMGVKSDLPRGIASGLTLGAVGAPREISELERRIDPNAGKPLIKTPDLPLIGSLEADARKLGELSTGFIPYVAASKGLSAIPALNQATRASQAARVGGAFGAVSTGRQAVNVAKGEEFRPDQILIDTAIGAAMGGLPSPLNATVKQRIFAAVAPQVAADVAQGTPVDQAATNAITNLLFEAAAGRKLGLSKERIGELRAQVEQRRMNDVQPNRGADAGANDIAGVGRVFPEGRDRTGVSTLDSAGERNVTGEPAAVPEPVATPQAWQHRDFGRVTESENQASVGRGRVRVVDESGAEHVIRRANLRGQGNQIAVPLRPAEVPASKPAELLPRGASREASIPREEVITPVENQNKEVIPSESTEVRTEQAAPILSEGEAGTKVPAEPLLKERPPTVVKREDLLDSPTTSARSVQMARDRAELDLPELPAPERKAWQKTLDEAKAAGTENAGILADQVLAKPRALNDVETGQLVLRAQEIKNQHAETMKEIGAAADSDVIVSKRFEAEALEREFDKITTATKKSGTEKGRALASQKLTINQDFDLVSVLQRAKAKRGRELRPEERAKLEQQTTRITELETQLAEANKKAEQRAIQKDIEKVRRQIKRGETKKVLDDEFVLLRQEFAQARIEAKGVQASGLAGLDPEGKLTPIILKMARNRVKSGVVKVEEVIESIHAAIKDSVDVSKDDIRQLLAGHNLERDPLPAIKTRLRGQEADLTRRLETKDFSKPEPRKKPVYDKEASDLKARVESLKRKVDAEIRGRDSILDTVLTLRKAGMLTGPVTHLRNVLGTAGFQGFEEAARIPGAIVDLATSAVTGRRALGGPSPVAVARSSFEAATKGVREAKQILQHGATAEELKIIERPREANSGAKILDVYMNTVFRTLGAEDKIFRTYAYKRSLLEQAKLRARSDGKSAKELEENPTADMVSQALLDSEVATFNSENAIAKKLNFENPVAKTAVDLVLPFRRTPLNIMSRLIEATPAGVVKGAWQVGKGVYKKEFSFEDQRKFSQTIGRSVTGSGLIALGYMLADKGLATGLYEEDRGDRELNKAAGKPPMAIKVGDKWRQIGSFSPIGNLIAIGAALHREKTRPPKEGEEPPNLIAAAGPIAARTVLDQPMLRGMSGVVDAIKDPGGRGSTLVGNTAASFIPTAVSSVGVLMDDKKRDNREGITSRIQSRVPILRERLPEDIDVFGRPVEARRTAVIDPTLTSTAKSDPFIKELSRLDVGVVKPNKKDGETDEKYRERMIAQGREVAKELATLTSSKGYAALSDEDKKDAIKNKITQVRKAVNDFLETGGKRKPREPRRPRQIPYRYNPNQ